MKASIYLAYHKQSPLFKGGPFQPIQVGRAGAGQVLPHMIGDDTGDHISQKNPTYCELTALYWAWKNDKKASHIGLMHYRRLLDFSGKHARRAAESAVGRIRIAQYIAESQAWFDQNPEIDLVVPKVHVMPVSVRENYQTRHRPEDLAALEQIIHQDHPDLLPYFNEVMAGRSVRLGNMFFARRAFVDQYCEALFAILAKIEAQDIDRQYYSKYQSRYIGFLAERIFTIFVAKYIAENKSARIHEVNIANIAQTACYPYIDDDQLNGPENVNIAFASDDAYLPHAAAMIASAVEHFSPKRQYNLFYLHSGISPLRLELFASIFAKLSHVHFHPINVGEPFSASYRSKTRAPSNATYNRFELFELLPTLKRILYIDCDMIVKGDLAEIFDLDMQGKMVAAVPDFIMTRSLNNVVETLDPQVKDLRKYQHERLGLSDAQIFNYFNAGLILFNFAAMDVRKVGADLVKMAKETRFLFRDQDILNAYFKDSYLRLPAKYNVFNSSPGAYSKVPDQNHTEAMKAKKDPFIIHYAAAYYKPWEMAEVEWLHEYWQALLKTPFFMTVLEQARRSGGNNGFFSKGFWIEQARKLAGRYPAIRPLLHKIYRKFFGGR